MGSEMCIRDRLLALQCSRGDPSSEFPSQDGFVSWILCGSMTEETLLVVETPKMEGSSVTVPVPVATTSAPFLPLPSSCPDTTKEEFQLQHTLSEPVGKHRRSKRVLKGGNPFSSSSVSSLPTPTPRTKSDEQEHEVLSSFLDKLDAGFEMFENDLFPNGPVFDSVEFDRKMAFLERKQELRMKYLEAKACLLYTSDAAETPYV